MAADTAASKTGIPLRPPPSTDSPSGTSLRIPPSGHMRHGFPPQSMRHTWELTNRSGSLAGKCDTGIFCRPKPKLRFFHPPEQSLREFSQRRLSGRNPSHRFPRRPATGHNSICRGRSRQEAGAGHAPLSKGMRALPVSRGGNRNSSPFIMHAKEHSGICKRIAAITLYMPPSSSPSPCGPLLRAVRFRGGRFRGGTAAIPYCGRNRVRNPAFRD